MPEEQPVTAAGSAVVDDRLYTLGDLQRRSERWIEGLPNQTEPLGSDDMVEEIKIVGAASTCYYCLWFRVDCVRGRCGVQLFLSESQEKLLVLYIDVLEGCPFFQNVGQLCHRPDPAF
jgi:hypothetical protein